MTQLVCSVDVDIPRRAVYDQWLRVEQFPLFLSDVQEVKQMDDRHVKWRTKEAAGAAEWVAQILEKVPDRRIEWRGLGPAIRSGMVTFDPLSDLKTRVTVSVDYEPEQFGSRAADLVALLSRRVPDALQSFKQHVESIGRAGGAPGPAAGAWPPPSSPPGPFGGGGSP